MNDLVKEYIETGKDLNSICDDKIKENNKQWALLVFLLAVIFIGYSCIITGRYSDLEAEHSKCDSLHKVDALTIDLQHKTLDSAVYFHEIKN